MGFIAFDGELVHTSQLPAGGKITISTREDIMTSESSGPAFRRISDGIRVYNLEEAWVRWAASRCPAPACI